MRKKNNQIPKKVGERNLLDASVAIRSKISLTKLLSMAMALFEIPVSGWTCLRTELKFQQRSCKMWRERTLVNIWGVGFLSDLLPLLLFAFNRCCRGFLLAGGVYCSCWGLGGDRRRCFTCGGRRFGSHRSIWDSNWVVRVVVEAERGYGTDGRWWYYIETRKFVLIWFYASLLKDKSCDYHVQTLFRLLISTCGSCVSFLHYKYRTTMMIPTLTSCFTPSPHHEPLNRISIHLYYDYNVW